MYHRLRRAWNEELPEYRRMGAGHTHANTDRLGLLASESGQAALLIVDVQRDFCAAGALEVPGGDRVVDPLNRLASAFTEARRPVYASRDWHPTESTHFTVHGGRWPVHCVANTPGAHFHDDLRLPKNAVIISKGNSPSDDGYSAFDGRTPSGISFEQDLRQRRVTHLWVGGLATDYCVRQSVLDAVRAGFDVSVVSDAIAGVDVADGDSARALDEMRAAGASLTTASALANRC